MIPYPHAFSRILDIIIPPRCLACLATVSTQHSFHLTCYGCRSDLASKRRDIPLSFSDDLGGDAVALYEYKGVIKRLVGEYKFNSKFILAEFFAELLIEYIGANPNFDFIVAIPSTRKSIRKRGFSHMDFLCEKLSRRTSVPRLHGALHFKRSSYRHRQIGLSSEQRYKNRVNSIHASRLDLLNAKKILLIDDVVTTGETLSAGRSALYSADVKRVDSIALARTTMIHTRK